MGLFYRNFTGSSKPEPASLVVGPDCDQDLSITMPEGLEVLNQIRVVHGKLSECPELGEKLQPYYDPQ